jgi:uncharacterized membrane protein YedE/YeeE
MQSFTPIASLVGGLLIGLGAAVLLLFNGRLAGISGIVDGLVSPVKGEVAWRAFFVAGLVGGGVVMALLRPGAIAMTLPRSTPALAIGGVLVGLGTRMANGCTSGHGLCGISRLSKRSMVATGVFMGVGMAVAVGVDRLFGGRL